MFYTEYRPQKFVDLINAKYIVSTITSAMAKNKAPHAYFLTGSRGIGKTTTARLIAKALNCEKPLLKKDMKDPPDYLHFEPCGKCKSCKAVEAGNHLDVIEIDAASNRGIENIRQLKDNVNLSPSNGKRKIYIVDEVHMLTKEASNAFLKTLEEPPAHVYFIFCTTDPEKVLETIKSRCQQFQFTRPSIEDITQKLRLIAKDKKYTVADARLSEIAILAKGAYREAETLLEQLINGDQLVVDALDNQEFNFFGFTSLVLNKSTADAIKFTHNVYQRGVNIELWTEKFIEYIRSLIFEKLQITGVDNTFVVNEAEKKLLLETNLDHLKKVIERFNQAISEFKFAIIPTLPLEMAIIDLSINLPGKISAVTNNPAPTKSPVPDDKPTKKAKAVDFPYSKLIEEVKPKNHSIHLLLRSCEFVNFDGQTLNIIAFYSFHQERLMTNRLRAIVEEVASKLVGTDVVVRCRLSDKRPNAKRLTDRNVVSAKETKLVSAFEKVFGDDVVNTS